MCSSDLGIPLGGRLGIEFIFREEFQFQNVTMLYFGVALQVRHQEHIAEAVVQLHLGHSQVIGINAQEIPLTEHGYEGNKAPWHN